MPSKAFFRILTSSARWNAPPFRAARSREHPAGPTRPGATYDNCRPRTACPEPRTLRLLRVTDQILASAYTTSGTRTARLARASRQRVSNEVVTQGALWGGVVRPVKDGGEKSRHGGGCAPSDDVPPVTSQRSDPRKHGDSIHRSTQNGTRDFRLKRARVGALAQSRLQDPIQGGGAARR